MDLIALSEHLSNSDPTAKLLRYQAEPSPAGPVVAILWSVQGGYVVSCCGQAVDGTFEHYRDAETAFKTLFAEEKKRREKAS